MLFSFRATGDVMLFPHEHHYGFMHLLIFVLLVGEQCYSIIFPFDSQVHGMKRQW